VPPGIPEGLGGSGCVIYLDKGEDCFLPDIRAPVLSVYSLFACDLGRSWRRICTVRFLVRCPRGGGTLQAPLLPSAQAYPEKM